MRQFPFGTSENPETPKSLLRSGREDISNQKSFMIRMVPNLQHTKTIHCLNFYQRPTTYNPKTKWTVQRIENQPCGPIFLSKKTGIIWSLLAVGMTF